jgi:2-polyprenyl-3-methyl-5-hydroxy-6-metoxy-1,4-benzoquinol methylase
VATAIRLVRLNVIGYGRANSDDDEGTAERGHGDHRPVHRLPEPRATHRLNGAVDKRPRNATDQRPQTCPLARRSVCDYGASVDDAFGAMLIDAFEGGNAAHEIVERDDGFIAVSTCEYLAPVRRWKAVERRALRYARSRVLDVGCGCGAGRVALELQARGRQVVAIPHAERWRSPAGAASTTFASCGTRMWWSRWAASGPC